MRRPKWTAVIWSDADWIYADLQSVEGLAIHTIKVPNDARGIQKILVLVRSRNAESRLGSRGEPTQEQIKRVEYDPAMVRRSRGKVQATPEQRATARRILREMGMI